MRRIFKELFRGLNLHIPAFPANAGFEIVILKFEIEGNV
jgi:hypothetical protein